MSIDKSPSINEGDSTLLGHIHYDFKTKKETFVKAEKNSDTLFEVEIKLPVNFCRTCIHRERHQCGGTIIQYCGLRKSNRTDNGKLKIKCKDAACASFKEK